jgi:hypothetical protein
MRRPRNPEKSMKMNPDRAESILVFEEELPTSKAVGNRVHLPRFSMLG